MRFHLRTLMIVLALGPPVLAAIWLYPWLAPIAFGGTAFLAVYLIAVPYCIAWIISKLAAFIGKISGQD